MRVYEELFIVKPDAPEEEVDAYIGQLKELITNGKGTVEKADKWGTRKLAYRVQKYNEGVYVLIQFSSSPELVKEVERRMRVTDLVIKFITVRIDETLKRFATVYAAAGSANTIFPIAFDALVRLCYVVVRDHAFITSSPHSWRKWPPFSTRYGSRHPRIHFLSSVMTGRPRKTSASTSE